MRQAATSTEFVHVPVTVPVGVDLSGVTPRIAFLPSTSAANPDADDWLTGAWGGTDALVLVGPNGGATELDPGSYWVWINVDPPGAENIVDRAPEPLTIF